MKRLFSVLLLFVLVLGICSCGQSVEEEFLLDLNGVDGEEKKLDLEGYECLIVQEYSIDQPFLYKEGTELADLYLKRLDDISEDYNCNISILGTNSRGIENQLPKIFSGVYVGEIANTHRPSWILDGNALHPLDTLIDYLDYTNAEKFGTMEMLLHGVRNGVPYTVTPVQWPGKQSSYAQNMFAVNEAVLTRYGKTDPREYVETGMWTWDIFDTILPDYHIVDGDFETSSMNITWNNIADFAVMNGVKYYAVTDSGEAVPDLKSSEVIETIDWIAYLCSQYSDCISFEGYGGMVSKFNNGEIILAQTSFSQMLIDIIYETENYGVVPMPCGPNGTYGEWVGAYGELESMGIWISAKEPEAAAIVIDKIFEPFEGYETLEDIKQYASNIFYDKRDVDFYSTYLKHLRYSMNSTVFSGEAMDMIKNGTSGAEIVDRFGDMANNAVEEILADKYEFIKNYEALVGNK